MDDLVIPVFRPANPWCGNERISCDSKKLLPLEQAVVNYMESNFGDIDLRDKNEVDGH